MCRPALAAGDAFDGVISEFLVEMAQSVGADRRRFSGVTVVVVVVVAAAVVGAASIAASGTVVVVVALLLRLSLTNSIDVVVVVVEGACEDVGRRRAVGRS